MKKIVNKEIKLSNIRISEQHWKREITEEDIAELAGSMADWGQFHQILVRPVGKTGRMYELISGERRFRGLKAAGFKTARCAVYKCQDDKMARIVSLEENFRTLKPSQREWQKGLKELKDLLAEKIEKEEKRKSARKKDLEKVAGSGISARDAQKIGPKKKKRGRPKDTNREATKKAAKAAGVSESAARRAIKREEDLIPSALLAMANGTITAEQADYLANMPAPRQRAELGIMMAETQNETRSRRNKTKPSRTKPTPTDTEVASGMLESVSGTCQALKQSVDELMAFMDGKEMDYSRLKRYAGDIKGTVSILESLVRFLED